MSTLPLRYAPSSMEIRWVVTSPVTIAALRNSTRSLAWILPSSFPCTTTPFASTLALTWPFGPTVRLLPLSVMLPSTWPSTYRSSLPESSPLTNTDLPMCANSAVFGVSIDFGLLGRISHLKLARDLQVTCDLPGTERLTRARAPNSRECYLLLLELYLTATTGA